jgi:hypothetical protein
VSTKPFSISSKRNKRQGKKAPAARRGLNPKDCN